MGLIKIESNNYGTITVKDCMIDVDGTNLEEGVTISTKGNIFKTFDIVGYCTDDFNKDFDIDELIENNATFR